MMQTRKLMRADWLLAALIASASSLAQATPDPSTFPAVMQANG